MRVYGFVQVGEQAEQAGTRQTVLVTRAARNILACALSGIKRVSLATSPSRHSPRSPRRRLTDLTRLTLRRYGRRLCDLIPGVDRSDSPDPGVEVQEHPPVLAPLDTQSVLEPGHPRPSPSLSTTGSHSISSRRSLQKTPLAFISRPTLPGPRSPLDRVLALPSCTTGSYQKSWIQNLWL